MDDEFPHWAMETRWRVGRKVGRTIYAIVETETADHDVLIGTMDTIELAKEAVRGHNAQFDGEAHDG